MVLLIPRFLISSLQNCETIPAGWHHWLDGHEFGWTPGDGDGQGGLACCDSWGRKESDTTERLNWLTDWTDRSFALSNSACSTLKRQSRKTNKMGEAEWVQPMSSQVESVALITLLPWEHFLISSVFCFLPWKCIYYHPSYKANMRLKWEKTCEALEVSGK